MVCETVTTNSAMGGDSEVDVNGVTQIIISFAPSRASTVHATDLHRVEISHFQTKLNT